MRNGRYCDRLTLPRGYSQPALLFENQSTESTSGVELLTIADAAEFLRISASGMRRLQHGRSIPFFKVGGSIRFAKNDLLSYLARQRVEPIDK